MTLGFTGKVPPPDEESSRRVKAFWDANTGVVREGNLFGISIEYISLTGKNGVDIHRDEDGVGRLAQIKLINGQNSVILQAVPVEDVSDKEVSTDEECALLKKRLCRISFGRLTRLQQGLLGTILSEVSD
jgi:hypothetical protein